MPKASEPTPESRRPFDTSFRRLMRMDPRAWVDLINPPGPVRGAIVALETQFTQVKARQADLALMINDGTAERWILHGELQSTADPKIFRRMAQYNLDLIEHYDVPCQSALILQRPSSSLRPKLRDALRSHHYWQRYVERTPGGREGFGLGYLQVELWRIPAQPLLDGPLATLPLASVAHLGRLRLSQVIDRIVERLRSQDVDPIEACDLAAITTMIMGLRSRDQPEYRTQIERIAKMFNFADSEAIDIIAAPRIQRAREEGQAEGEALGRKQGEALGRKQGEALGRKQGEALGQARGRIEVARALLIDLGTARFGPPDSDLLRQIHTCDEPERLQQIASQIIALENWEAIGDRLGGA